MKKRDFYSGKLSTVVMGVVASLMGITFIVGGISTAELGFALGGVFFVGVGILVFVLHVKEQNGKRQLIGQGRYVWGTITEYAPAYHVEINGRHPYLAVVRYNDAQGNTPEFHSEPIGFELDESLLGKTVKVYINDESYSKYYVDLDSLYSRLN